MFQANTRESGFSPEDVEINSRGNLSAAQHQKLISKRGYHIFMIVVQSIGAIIIFGFMFTSQRAQDSTVSDALLSVLILVFPVWLLLTVLSYLQIRLVNQDLLPGEVTVVRGTFEGLGRSSIGGPLFGGFKSDNARMFKPVRLVIAGVEIEFPEMATRALRKGETYDVYYTPRSKVMLSMRQVPLNEVMGWSSNEGKLAIR